MRYFVCECLIIDDSLQCLSLSDVSGKRKKFEIWSHFIVTVAIFGHLQ